MFKKVFTVFVSLILVLSLFSCSANTNVLDLSTSIQSVLTTDVSNVNLSDIPAYSDKAYISINSNMPVFSASDLTTTAYEKYADLDSLGRCGVAQATCGKEIMPKEGEERGSISSIKPTGWAQAQYDNVSGKNLYNRCHLIGWQLSAENANKKNLITGTRYMNTEGMLPFENMVADYINETGNHVAYRITPVYNGNNLVASGVQMEAYSIEDDGEGICFNVYCYNVQPGIKINYLTGKSEKADVIYDEARAIPFAVSNPNDDNPDLIYEMSKHLEILFANQKEANSSIYTTMMGDINSIAYEARSLGKLDEKPAQTYIKMKKCEYEYFNTLKMYVPILLKNEDFFVSEFGE